MQQYFYSRAFEFNTTGKTPERVTLAEEWNSKALLVAAGFGKMISMSIGIIEPT
jgi:hypothetical protein